MKAVAHFNPMAPETVEDPYEFYTALREQAPVYEVPGLGLYIVSRYDDVLQVVRNPKLFSSKSGPAAMPPAPEVVEIVRTGYVPVDTLLTNDPPAHARYRSLVNHAFTPSRVARLEPYMRALAHELIDTFAARGRVELVREFAVPFPLTIIADQLGVPRADMPAFKRWSDDSVAPLGGMISHQRQLECARSLVEFQRYFEEKVAALRGHPRDDMLSALVEARLEGGEPLNLAELLSILQQILVAGNETTTNLIASAMMLLLRHPDQLALVVADPSLVPNMIEEALRLESPATAMFRMATEETELAGVRIPKGARLVVHYAAANRDQRQFPDPDRFDVRRENARTHLAFGFGQHYCIGAGLARKEGAVAFEALLSRLGDLRFAAGNDFTHHPSFILRGLKELHVEFRPL